MKKVIFNDPRTGAAAICEPAYKDLARAHSFPNMSDDDILMYVINHDIPKDSEGNIVEHYIFEGILPDKALFRDSWRVRNGDIVVDMDGARLAHMVNIRAERNSELVKLDLESLRAFENEDVAEQQRVTEVKQKLRDIPQTFDLTTPNDTPEELKAKWPTELPARE
jgi:hypothetical protein